ncbi:MAG: sulfotransferase domain-containing protein [Microcoleaceae cyanobacterium]
MIHSKANLNNNKKPPHFIILGTQKGGTNSLYYYLIQHPQILSATQKEIQYFSLNYQKSWQWYQSQFPSEADGENQITGEGSPYYLFHPQVPQRVYETCPNTQFIVLLRNPVDRGISHYYWQVKLGFESLSFPAAITQETQRLTGEFEKLEKDPNYYSYNHQHFSYLSRGVYINQLQRWFKYFPKHQFLFLQSERFYDNPKIVVNQVFQFFGLEPYVQPEYPVMNANTYPKVSSTLRQKLIEYFEPYNQQLTDLLNIEFNWNIPQIKQMNKINYEGAWNDYVQNWQKTDDEQTYPGDEWIGASAGAAKSLAEYETLIEQQFIKPYIQNHQTVLEIGIGGGKTAALLLRYCQNLICADISQNMINITRNRLGEERVSYVKLNGLNLGGIKPSSIDICFCYDTMVHIEPRDIFNYLTQIPALMKGERLCLFHHTNMLSDLGWQKFLQDWDKNLMGQRHGTAFSVMTDAIMEKFLTHLNYKIIHKDTQTVPRDCIWICQAPNEN